VAIQAIETRYAGCRFRSRLEARWAVFFDTLSIPWEYEPEGFELGDGERYLPDFRLLRPNGSYVYVEVKGDDSMASNDYREMLSSAVDYHGPLENGLLLLGPIPDVSRASVVLHSRLVWKKGDYLESVEWRYLHQHSYLWPYVGVGSYEDGWSAPGWSPEATWKARVLEVALPEDQRWFPLNGKLKAAYEAARSARFEHGESG